MVSPLLIKLGISLSVLVVSLIIYKIIIDSISKRTKIGKLPEKTKIVKEILKIIILIILALILINIWGFEIQNVWIISASILTLIGVGFIASWSLLCNIIAALLIFFTRTFKIGDYIIIIPDNVEGKVSDMGSMFTSLKEENGNEIKIPNSLFFQKIIKKTNRNFK